LIDGTHLYVAAGPAGKLYGGKLVCLRDSIESDGKGARMATNGLPMDVRQRMRHLLEKSRFDKRLVAAEDRDLSPAEQYELKLQLFDLVRINDGAFHSYVLGELLLVTDAWTSDKLSATALRTKARRLLAPLRPDRGYEEERIKVVLKSLCRAFVFDRPPDL